MHTSDRSRLVFSTPHLCFRILYGYVVHKSLITQISSRKALQIMQMVQIPVRKHLQTAHIIQIHHAALFSKCLLCCTIPPSGTQNMAYRFIFPNTWGTVLFCTHKNSCLQFYRVGCQVGFALLIDEDIFYALSYEQATHETKSELYQN